MYDAFHGGEIENHRDEAVQRTWQVVGQQYHQINFIFSVHMHQVRAQYFNDEKNYRHWAFISTQLHMGNNIRNWQYANMPRVKGMV